MEWDEWKSAIFQVFGKRSRQKWNNLVINLLSVCHGIKPTYLFDLWSSTSSEMFQLLQGIHDKRLTPSHLNLLVLNSDLIIYCKGNLKACLQREVIFIDVSHHLPRPTALQECKVLQIRKYFAQLVDKLNIEVKLSSAFCGDDQNNITTVKKNCASCVDSPIEWYEIENCTENLTCLFGLFLGYPCVYWYDVSDNWENCLSFQSLQLYQIKASLASPNIPCANNYINRDAGEFCSKTKICEDRAVSQLSNFSSMNRIDNDLHILFSFSVPTLVMNDMSEKDQCFVNKWFRRWKSETPWDSLFSSVCLEEDAVVLPAVSL